MAGAMEVDNTWICESTLGSGSFGIVQLWKNTRNGEKFAIKKCKSGNAQLTTKQRERWIHEVEIMNGLQHQNIVATKPVPIDVEKIEPSLPVLCMEYCSKGDLRHVLTDSENCCGLKEQVAVQIMKDISGAVEYLHSRALTHRDLKPENVVLQQIHNKVVYKLIDLGYAKELGHDSMYASIVGTLNYVAPELLWKQKYTCSVDYWSLGILFYEIVTGFRPFLPDESNPLTWKKHVENKSYNDICAENVNGIVVFQQDIQDPTDISPCIRNALVNWFRLVLQWDSKKRGKQHRENGTYELVIFKMLTQILSKKIVRIFCVSQYKIYCYEVEDTTTVAVLQSWIQRDTQITISSQELINDSGEVLNNNDILQDTFLTLFRREGKLIDSAVLSLPTLVRKIIEMPKMEMTHYELKRHYSAAMFFAKEEVELFRYYILGLSSKIDLINSSIDVLLSKNCEMMSGMNSLKDDFYSMIELIKSYENGLDRWKKEIQTAKTKLEHLSEIVEDLKAKCDQIFKIRETLREFVDVDWMTKYSELLNEVQCIMESCQSRRTFGKQRPIDMATLMVKFLKLRESHTDPKLAKFGRQIRLMATVQVTEERLKLEQYIESAVALTTAYRKEMSDSCKKWKNHEQATSSDINVESTMELVHPSLSSIDSTNTVESVTSDNVIYDNLVIRYMMHDFMSEMYERFLRIVNLNLEEDEMDGENN